MIVSPLGYMIYYQEKFNNWPIEMKRIKRKKLVKDYEIRLIKDYINKDYINNELIIEYFAK
tara:strand:- start:328 stop:510 length:183 start_codon:yes stop_codon:yes gene_type:complete